MLPDAARYRERPIDGAGEQAKRMAIDITSLPAGDKEHQVADLARGLAQRGHSVLLLINNRRVGS